MVGYPLYITYNTLDSFAPPTIGVAASATNTYYSKPWSGRDGWSLVIETTGTLTGTWTLWVSNKQNPSETDDSDWEDASAHTQFVETNPAGSATKWSVHTDHFMGRFFRLKYVNTSGTGNLLADVA